MVYCCNFGVFLFIVFDNELGVGFSGSLFEYMCFVCCKSILFFLGKEVDWVDFLLFKGV